MRRNPGLDSNIPKKADELLSSLGQEVDTREMQRITQVPPLLSCRNSLVLIRLVIIRSFVNAEKMISLMANMVRLEWSYWLCLWFWSFWVAVGDSGVLQEESFSRSQAEMMKQQSSYESREDFTPSQNTAGPPVYYPTGQI